MAWLPEGTKDGPNVSVNARGGLVFCFAVGLAKTNYKI